MNKIILDFTYEKAEYIKGYQSYLIASKKIRKSDLLVVLALVPLLTVYMVKSGFRPILMAALAIAVLAAATGCTLYFYTPRKVYNQTAKLKEIYHLEFDDYGIQFSTDSIHSNLTWSVYKEAWEGKDFYYLIQGGYQFTMIPRRAMDEQKQKAFRRLLKDKFSTLKKI